MARWIAPLLAATTTACIPDHREDAPWAERTLATITVDAVGPEGVIVVDHVLTWPNHPHVRMLRVVTEVEAEAGEPLGHVDWGPADTVVGTLEGGTQETFEARLTFGDAEDHRWHEPAGRDCPGSTCTETLRLEIRFADTPPDAVRLTPVAGVQVWPDQSLYAIDDGFEARSELVSP